MTALTADRNTTYREGLEVDIPVYTNTTIYAGSMVCVNSSGYAIPAANASGNTFVGVAMEYVANSGASGAKTVRVRTEGVFDFAASSISQAHLMNDMYVVDDQTFDESDPGHGVKCGKLIKYVSGTRGWLMIGKALASAFSGSADSLTVSDAGDYFPASTNTVAEQIQTLASAPMLLCVSCATITSAASDQVILADFEFPVPVKIKRAYATLGTAPGADKTLTIECKVGAGADTTLCTVTGTNTTGENESLDIAVPANTDFDIMLTQDTGSAAALNLILHAVLDDGES